LADKHVIVMVPAASALEKASVETLTFLVSRARQRYGVARAQDGAAEAPSAGRKGFAMDEEKPQDEGAVVTEAGAGNSRPTIPATTPRGTAAGIGRPSI
jgi:hypothetical protein